VWPFSRPDPRHRSPSQRIAEEAEARLRNDPHVNRRHISCECHQGVLLLRGELPSFYEKQVAQEAVKGVEGIAGIVNDIEVTW